MPGATLLGGRELAAKPDAMPGRIRDSLPKKATTLAHELEAKVRTALGSGTPNVRSGAPRHSFVVNVADNAAGVIGSIASSGDVKSAAIHELGATVPAREILPDKAKALAFAVNGKRAFVAQVLVPAAAAAGRSQPGPSLAQMVDATRQELRETVIAAMR